MLSHPGIRRLSLQAIPAHNAVLKKGCIMENVLKKFERVIVLSLMAFMMLAITITTIEVGIILCKDLINAPFMLLNVQDGLGKEVLVRRERPVAESPKAHEDSDGHRHEQGNARCCTGRQSDPTRHFQVIMSFALSDSGFTMLGPRDPAVDDTTTSIASLFRQLNSSLRLSCVLPTGAVSRCWCRTPRDTRRWRS